MCKYFKLLDLVLRSASRYMKLIVHAFYYQTSIREVGGDVSLEELEWRLVKLAIDPIGNKIWLIIFVAHHLLENLLSMS